MATLATWVVPPTSDALLFGVSAVVISARKVRLVDLAGREVASVTHRQQDGICDSKPFSELVSFVRGKICS